MASNLQPIRICRIAQAFSRAERVQYPDSAHVMSQRIGQVHLNATVFCLLSIDGSFPGKSTARSPAGCQIFAAFPSSNVLEYGLNSLSDSLYTRGEWRL